MKAFAAGLVAGALVTSLIWYAAQSTRPRDRAPTATSSRATPPTTPAPPAVPPESPRAAPPAGTSRGHSSAIAEAIPAAADAGAPPDDPAAVFEREHRVERWAADREAFFAREYAADLALHYPGSELGAVECRATTCRIAVVGPAGAPTGILPREIQRAFLGDRFAPSFGAVTADGRPTFVLDLAFTATHDPALFAEVYAQVRAEWRPRDAGP